MVVVTITPEICVDDDLKTRIGSLGVLEGDKFYGASDLGLEYVVLTLTYSKGYIDLKFRGEEPIAIPQEQNPRIYSSLYSDEPFKILLRNEEVYIKPWNLAYNG